MRLHRARLRWKAIHRNGKQTLLRWRHYGERASRRTSRTRCFFWCNRNSSPGRCWWSMAGDPPEWETDFIKMAPLRRTGKPEDVTDTVLFLVQSKFITGQVLVVDGRRSTGMGNRLY